MMMDAECGDRVYTRVPSLFNRLQKFFVTHFGECRTRATHVGGVVRIGEVVNAHWPRVRCETLDDYLAKVEAKGGAWCIVRDAKPLCHCQQTQWDFLLRSRVGYKYSVPELFGQGLDGLVNKVSIPVFGKECKVFRWLIDRTPDWVICSGLIAGARIALHKIDPALRLASPDDLWDDEQRRRAVIVARSDTW